MSGDLCTNFVLNDPPHDGLGCTRRSLNYGHCPLILFAILKEYMSQISLETIKKIAALSGLALNEADLEKFRVQFEEILGYVEQLNDVDTSGLAPSYQVTGLTNVMRADEIIDYGVSQDKLLSNAPSQRDGSIEVRKVL